MCGSWSVDYEGQVGGVFCSDYTDYVEDTCTSDKEVKASPLCSTFYRQSGQWGEISYEPLRPFIRDVMPPRSEALWNVWLKYRKFLFRRTYEIYREKQEAFPLTL